VDLPQAGGLPDQDVNLLPVSARLWRPPSRSPFQQLPRPFPFTLADQDVQLRPITPGVSAFLRYQGRQLYLVRVYFPSTTDAVAEVKYAFMSWTPVALASMSFQVIDASEETADPVNMGGATIEAMPTGNAVISVVPLTSAEEDFD
jgi:hypothetical protein